MIRSKEVMRNKMPEAMPPKVLAHIQVHPQMGGGVRVEHHHTEPVHPPIIHNFKPQQGEAFADHMMQHSGMSWEPEQEGAKQENAGSENEVQGLDGDHA